MELSKTDYENETADVIEGDILIALTRLRKELSQSKEDAATLREELSQSKEDAAAQRTLNTEESILLDDIRLSLFKLLKDQIGAMVSGEIAEQLKTKETAFDISDHFDEIREDITYNFDISSFQTEIEEIASERDIDDEVTEIVKDVLKRVKITLG